MQTDILRKFNVNIQGHGKQTLVFAHGFGSDQTAWRHQVAAFQADYRIVMFDYLGCGATDSSNYNPLHYNSLHRYADDLLSIYRALDLRETIFVGHSASAMIGMIASKTQPTWFRKLVFISGSPRYLNDQAYIGGFEQRDLHVLYNTMAANYLGWANGFGPLAMGKRAAPELGQEFAEKLSAMRPDIAQSTARVIFESDLRAELTQLQHPVLLLHATNDIAVPLEVGYYLAAHIPRNQLIILNAEGHFAHLSAPTEVIQAIRTFITTDDGHNQSMEVTGDLDFTQRDEPVF